MAQHESAVPHPAQHLLRGESLAPPAAQEPSHDAHAHPTARVYIEVAVILAVITIVELFTLYLPAIGLAAARPFLVPAFIFLSATKFLLVIGWYMHLRFDPLVFRRIFGFALIVALTIATAFIALFHGIYP
jgi:cytochrome c oxidase subunit 4